MKKLIMIIFFLSLPSLIMGQWKKVKKYMSKSTAEVITETDDKLVIQLKDTSNPLQFVFSNNPDDKNADIIVTYEQKLTSNPYKVYKITEKLKNDKSKPKKLWKQFLKTRFIALLRK